MALVLKDAHIELDGDDLSEYFRFDLAPGVGGDAGIDGIRR